MKNISSELVKSFNELYKQNRRVNNFDLSEADFSERNLSQLHAENTNFQSSNFSKVDLSKSRFTKCDFKKAVMANVNLTESVIRLCAFNGVDAKSAILKDAVLEDSQIESADFSCAILQGAKLTDTNWSRSSLHKVNLDGAKGDGVCFRGADLTNASLAGVQFIDADFRGADLSNANLANGDFTGADFRGAILDNIVWDGARVLGALFDKGFQMNMSQGVSSENDETNDSEVSDEELAQAVEKIVSGVFSQTAKYFKHDDELKNFVGKINKWNKQKNKMDIEAISGLADQLEKSFAGSNMIPPEIISSLKSIVHVLNDTSANEPSNEIKELLRKFFPEIKEGEMESLDQIISKYSSIIKNGK